jgi:hypothetical protein
MLLRAGSPFDPASTAWRQVSDRAAVVFLAVECGVVVPATDEFLDAWRAGAHPVQAERRAVEAALLSAACRMPGDVALFVGDFMHARPRRARRREHDEVAAGERRSGKRRRVA